MCELYRLFPKLNNFFLKLLVFQEYNFRRFFYKKSLLSDFNAFLDEKTMECLKIHKYLFPKPYSLLPTPYSLLPNPYSLLPNPYSRIPTPESLLFENPPTLQPSNPPTLPPSNDDNDDNNNNNDDDDNNDNNDEYCCECCFKYTRRASYNLLITQVVPNVSHKLSYVHSTRIFACCRRLSSLVAGLFSLLSFSAASLSS